MCWARSRLRSAIPWPAISTEDTDMGGATLVWLDALAGGLCTPEAFLAGMREHINGDPDECWEALSLLDQYYRRGKIKPEIFHTVKSQLESSALNVDDDAVADAVADT